MRRINRSGGVHKRCSDLVVSLSGSAQLESGHERRLEVMTWPRSSEQDTSKSLGALWQRLWTVPQYTEGDRSPEHRYIEDEERRHPYEREVISAGCACRHSRRRSTVGQPGVADSGDSGWGSRVRRSIGRDHVKWVQDACTVEWGHTWVVWGELREAALVAQSAPALAPGSRCIPCWYRTDWTCPKYTHIR